MRLTRGAAALSLVIALTGTALMPTPALAAGCSTNSIVPSVADAMVNQGLPYSTLVRGKAALVRFYLQLPACSVGTPLTISLTSASLTANVFGGGSLGAPIADPLDLLTAAETETPTVAPYTAATTDDPEAPKRAASNASPANPRFAIPASYLDPTNPAGAFTASFTLTVSYTYDTNGPGEKGGTGTVTGKQLTPALSASVNPKSRGLRILSVPMGNPDSGFAGQPILEGAFGTMSRVFPVPEGTGSLETADTGGVRYKVLPTVMDIAALTSGGEFCGSAGNALPIRALLATYLAQYNATNDPTRGADRVLGAIDEASSSSSCAQGYAGIGTKEAWIRTVPRMAGALMSMEEAHNSGATTPLREDADDRTHSPNVEADEKKNRAYRLSDNAYLVKDRTALNFRDIAEWNDDTVVMERADWEQAFCRLGGPVTGECVTPAPEGALLGGAASQYSTTAVLVGLTDGTAEGTDVTDSYFAAGPLTTPPSSGDFRYVQLKGTEVLSDLPVTVHGLGSLHDDHHESADVGFFSVAYPFRSDADRWELRHGAEVLAARDRIAAPTVTAPVMAPSEGEQEGIGFDEAAPLSRPSYPGLNFSSGALVTADPTTSSLPNAVLSPENDSKPLIIGFAEPVYEVGMNIGNGVSGVTATLKAFDATGAEVASTTATGFGKPVNTPIEVRSALGIRRVELLYTRIAGLPVPSEEIDDLSFTPGVGPSIFDVSATATTEGDPNNLRGAFFVQCPALNASGAVIGDQNLPIAAGLKPSSISGQTATFSFRWNGQGSCENGQVASIAFRSDDGYTNSPFSETELVSVPEIAPDALISSPVIDAAVLEHEVITLSGQGYDRTDGVLPGDRLEWFVTGPEFPAETSVGKGTSLQVSPPGGDWEIGTYTVRLEATDFEGLKSSTTATVDVLEDEDNDGIPKLAEQCYADATDPTPDSNPYNAWGDADADGYANVSDPAACVPAADYVFGGNFDPSTLFVPSSGNPVTFHVTTRQRNLAEVTAGSIRLSRIAGIDVDPIDPLFNGTPVTWSVVSPGIASIKFDRSSLTAWLSREGLVGRWVQFEVTGTGATGSTPWTFESFGTTFSRPSS